MKIQTTKPLSISVILFFLLIIVCFTSPVLADQDHSQEHEFNFSFFSLVRPLGVCALASLLVTFSLGLLRKKLGKRFLKIHRTFAWLTITFALCHGILVLVLY